jgi:hypothetical protein
MEGAADSEGCGVFPVSPVENNGELPVAFSRSSVENKGELLRV